MNKYGSSHFTQVHTPSVKLKTFARSCESELNDEQRKDQTQNYLRVTLWFAFSNSLPLIS